MGAGLASRFSHERGALRARGILAALFATVAVSVSELKIASPGKERRVRNDRMI